MLQPAVLHFEHLLAKSLAAALGALHVDVGHELHVDREVAVAVAGFATAAIDVETEVAGRQPARAGVDLFGEQRADRIERFDVRGRVRARRAADRALVDVDDIFNLARAEHIVVLQRLSANRRARRLYEAGERGQGRAFCRRAYFCRRR